MVQENSLKKIVVVCGPTGAGKTAVAIDIAEKFNGEIVSADSVAIYRGLDVGSAKPTKEQLARAKHYMIDVVSPFDSFSVSDFERSAIPIVEDIISRGKLPIVCGGTGFYVNSILYKLSYGNHSASPEIREKYEEILKEKGKEYLFGLLKETDGETAKKLHPNDVVRVVRALEIYETTGVKKSEIKDELTPRYDFVALTPVFERSALYSRIDRRVDEMFENGLEREVVGLLEKGVTVEMQCMQGIGYKETARAILNGEEMPLDEIKANSRRYAKRQITFFKRTRNLLPLNAENSDYSDKIINSVYDFLNE